MHTCVHACVRVVLANSAHSALIPTVLLSWFAQEMESIFDPSRNMARYRSVVKAASPPLVPLFPLIMKDLTFFHEGMKSRENGLINFEKLRLLAREIRQAKAYCNKVIEVVCLCVRACVCACVCV